MYSAKPLLHKRQNNYRPGQLRSIAIDVTSKCNMSCPRCYAETFVHATPVELTYLHKAFDEFFQMGVFHYILQGGEPISDLPRLEAILEMCHPLESYINVVTNGLEMTHERIKWLKERNVDKIAFSLDSGIESEHDAGRVSGSYAKVVQAIDIVLQEGLLASISCVVTHESLYSDGFNRAYEFAREKGIRIDVQIAEPVGKWDGNVKVLINEEDARYIKKMQVDGPVLKNGQKMVNRDIFSGSTDHCPAVTAFMGLTVDGQLLPCNFLQFSLGNIRDKTITEMRNSLLNNRWFNGKHPVCLCGEDREFINKFILPFTSCMKPLDASIFQD